MMQLEITGQLILDLFKIVVRCLNRPATSVGEDLPKRREVDGKDQFIPNEVMKVFINSVGRLAHTSEGAYWCYHLGR